MARRRPDTSMLAATAPFDQLRPRALRPLAPHVDRLGVPEGTVLAREDETARAFIVVLEGEVIERRAGADVGRSGAGTEIGHGSTFVAASDLDLLVVNGPAYRWAVRALLSRTH
jgi:CRP-like cAMP-binding protein